MSKYLKAHPNVIWYSVMVGVMSVGWVWAAAHKDARLESLAASHAQVSKSVEELTKNVEGDHETLVRQDERQKDVQEDVREIRTDVKTLIRQINKNH